MEESRVPQLGQAVSLWGSPPLLSLICFVSRDIADLKQPIMTKALLVMGNLKHVQKQTKESFEAHIPSPHGEPCFSCLEPLGLFVVVVV